jgi:hypothetical protein
MTLFSVSRLSAVTFVASLSCLSVSAWGLLAAERGDVYGADNCNADCTENDPLIVNECAHNSDADKPPNDCEADACLRNIIFRAKCSGTAEGSDCLFTPPFPGTSVVQEERAATNCATTNPLTWTDHKPGPCEWNNNHQTRCETGACDGAKTVPDRTAPGNLQYCSH